jgi:hypothetical protein
MSHNREYNHPEIGFQRVCDSDRLNQLDKLQQSGKVGGSCIRENSERLIQLWDKGHIHLKMAYLKIKLDKKLKKEMKYKKMGKYINHFMIQCSKRNKFIDVSNGKMRMIDVDAYGAINDVKHCYTFDKNHFDKYMMINQGEERVDVLAGLCNRMYESI